MTEEIDFNVYKSYPPEFIQQALDDFKNIMFNGGGIDELNAGLHGLDFLTRGSDVPQPLSNFVDAAINEAKMRIEIMTTLESDNRSFEEAHKKLFATVNQLDAGIKNLQRRITMSWDEQTVINYVRKITDKNMEKVNDH